GGGRSQEQLRQLKSYQAIVGCLSVRNGGADERGEGCTCRQRGGGRIRAAAQFAHQGEVIATDFLPFGFERGKRLGEGVDRSSKTARGQQQGGRKEAPQVRSRDRRQQRLGQPKRSPGRARALECLGGTPAIARLKACRIGPRPRRPDRLDCRA